MLILLLFYRWIDWKIVHSFWICREVCTMTWVVYSLIDSITTNNVYFVYPTNAHLYAYFDTYSMNIYLIVIAFILGYLYIKCALHRRLHQPYHFLCTVTVYSKLRFTDTLMRLVRLAWMVVRLSTLWVFHEWFPLIPWQIITIMTINDNFFLSIRWPINVWYNLPS